MQKRQKNEIQHNTHKQQTTTILSPLTTINQEIRCKAYATNLASTMRGRTLLGPFHTDANHPRERSRSSFGLSVHTHANVRANCLCEQFASFT